MLRELGFDRSQCRRHGRKFDRDAFKLGNIDATMQHSTRFTLVDRQGRIRGYYDTSDPSSIPKLVSDIQELERERT